MTRHDFDEPAGWVITVVAVLAIVSALTACSTVPAAPVIQVQRVDVPYPVNCTGDLPPVRTSWPAQKVSPGANIREMVAALVEDDAAWRDYAHAYEAATAGCR
jgi:hypothetical protein